MGKHQDWRAGSVNNDRSELYSSGSTLHPTGAALRCASTGKYPPLQLLILYSMQYFSFSVNESVVSCVHQGLGLLINLVEYSSRNRHCLVDMEYSIDDTCLEDSLMQPSDSAQLDAAAQSADTQGDAADKPKPSGALAALVKVQTAWKD